MTSSSPVINIEKVDAYLFKSGTKLEQYFIERTSGADVICYIDPDGHCFDLFVDDDKLYSNLRDRLLDLGVKLVV
ncbi:hypothetical protein J9978_08190 [Chromobacterium violaceum]|uniref:hypothetical protein n=1 Tax=Chromobacterium violaceum TaxID=536 RepID=UPI001B3451A4|nr:hypothetical protein [Chromobacterium violaceum]MBP4049476.1 hypothetical protein [Chromobacterium violaceum]